MMRIIVTNKMKNVQRRENIKDERYNKDGWD